MSLRTALQRLLPFRQREASLPLRLLRTAARHRSTVQLFLLGQQRQMENIPCKIERVDKQSLVLRHAGPWPTDCPGRGQCSLYFKLPLAAHLYLPGLTSSRAHEGFLCQTRIMEGRPQPDGGMRLHLRLPATALQRELRRHDRYFISPGCVEMLELWLPWDPPSAGLPADLPTDSSASFNASRRQARLRLVNLSAGGAKLQIDNVDFTEDLANMDLKQALIRLQLRGLHQPQPESWLLCRCVESRYNIHLSRLVLRLSFCQYRDARADNWDSVGEQGVAVLQHWLAQDHAALLKAPASLANSQSCIDKD